MNFAVRKLTEELEDQLSVRLAFENKPHTENTQKVLDITKRRIKELEEALKLLQGVPC